MMHRQIIIVVLPVSSVQIAYTYLAQIVVSLPYLLTLCPPSPGASEAVDVCYIFSALWFLSAVILAVVNFAAVLA